MWGVKLSFNDLLELKSGLDCRFVAPVRRRRDLLDNKSICEILPSRKMGKLSYHLNGASFATFGVEQFHFNILKVGGKSFWTP